MFMLNFTYLLLNTFLKKKIYFELQVGFYSNTLFQSYAVYKLNDETYSLDMLATSQYQRVASYQRPIRGFDKNSLVQKSDVHRHTS